MQANFLHLHQVVVDVQESFLHLHQAVKQRSSIIACTWESLGMRLSGSRCAGNASFLHLHDVCNEHSPQYTHIWYEVKQRIAH